jgi:hypothetical protein
MGVPSDRSQHGRTTGEQLGDRPDFDEWMRDVESAIESREAQSSDPEAISKSLGRRGWFVRVKSLPSFLLHRVAGSLLGSYT